MSAPTPISPAATPPAEASRPALWGSRCHRISGLLLLVTLVAAPWMYGSTRHDSIIALCLLLSATVACWGGGILLEGRHLRLPPVLFYSTLFLVATGWFGVFVGTGVEVDAFSAQHFGDLSDRWPGGFLVKGPVETMWLYTGLLGVLLLTADLAAEARWRKWLVATMATTGASIVGLGILQIKTGAVGILWEKVPPTPGYFFATFFHHTSAGAFINLTWPLAAAPFLGSYCRAAPGEAKTRRETLAWGAILLLTLCGPLAQVSKFAQFNSVLLATLLVIWTLWRGRAALRKTVLRLVRVAVVVTVFLAVVGWSAGKLPHIMERSRSLLTLASTPASGEPEWTFRVRPDGFIQNPESAAGKIWPIHQEVLATSLRMLPKVGLTGFGPGSWSAVYPRFTDDAFLRTFYLHTQFAHLDYLQTLAEWGFLGCAAWALIVLGGLRALCIRLFFPRTWLDAENEMLRAGLLAALIGVLLHALIDFPLQIPSIQLYVAVMLGMAWAGVKGHLAARKIREVARSVIN